MSDEIPKLVAKLAGAQRELTAAKRLLEEFRQGGVAAEQKVVTCREYVHQLKDQIAAVAGKS